MAVDVREKLVELLDEAEEWADCKCDELGCESCPADKMKGDCVQQLMVDRLIAHGVTVQEWISVDDRLPEENINVMACLWIGEESRVYPAVYARGVWWDCVFGTPTTNTTTHWQPMPQPPKGE